MAKKSKAAKKKQAKARTAVAAGRETTQVAVPDEPAPAPRPKPKPVPSKSKGPSLSERMGGGPAVWWSKSVQFFREVKVELKKVTWPSRKEALASTSVVVALVLLSAIFLGLVDLGLSRLIRTVIG
jgi:preprotein translocase subunit SecE